MKGILHSISPGHTLASDTMSVVFDLLLMSREQTVDALRACVRIAVRKNLAGSPGFYVEGIPGSSSHFGINQCLSPRNARAALRHAFRVEIDEQLRAFRKSAFHEGMVCPVTGRTLTPKSLHAHHDGMSLMAIGTEFWWREFTDERDVAYENNGMGSTFVDRELAKRWKQFHAETATLILMSEEGHRIHHGNAR